MYQLSSGAANDGRSLARTISDAVRVPATIDSLPRDTMSWLQASEEEHNFAHLMPHFANEDLTELCRQLCANRPAFLQHLKGIGIERLADRQKIANVLGRDLRERRIWLPGTLEPESPAGATPQAPALRPALSRVPAQLESKGLATQPVLPEVLARLEGGSSQPLRDAAESVDDDAVMASIRRVRPASAWQEASRATAA